MKKADIKQIVQAMIDGGVNPHQLLQDNNVKHYDEFPYHSFEVTDDYPAHPIVFYFKKKVNYYEEYHAEYSFSLPDLILNPDAMRALCIKGFNLSEMDMTEEERIYWWGKPAYIYHMMQCARIIGEGEGDVIKYLRGLITPTGGIDKKTGRKTI